MPHLSGRRNRKAQSPESSDRPIEERQRRREYVEVLLTTLEVPYHADGSQMDTEWRVVRTCTWLHEALFLKSVLDAAGIEAMIPDEHTVSMQPLYANALGGIRILVRPDDVERASELLNSAELPPDDPLEDPGSS